VLIYLCDVFESFLGLFTHLEVADFEFEKLFEGGGEGDKNIVDAGNC
jgi:hypothetical protein